MRESDLTTISTESAAPEGSVNKHPVLPLIQLLEHHEISITREVLLHHSAYFHEKGFTTIFLEVPSNISYSQHAKKLAKHFSEHYKTLYRLICACVSTGMKKIFINLNQLSADEQNKLLQFVSQFKVDFTIDEFFTYIRCYDWERFLTHHLTFGGEQCMEQFVLPLFKATVNHCLIEQLRQKFNIVPFDMPEDKGEGMLQRDQYGARFIEAYLQKNKDKKIRGAFILSGFCHFELYKHMQSYPPQPVYIRYKPHVIAESTLKSLQEANALVDRVIDFIRADKSKVETGITRVVVHEMGSIKEDVSQFFESLFSEHDSLISQPAYQYDIKTSRRTDSPTSTQAHSAMFSSSEHRGSNKASHTNVSHDTAQADVSSGRG